MMQGAFRFTGPCVLNIRVPLITGRKGANVTDSIRNDDYPPGTGIVPLAEIAAMPGLEFLQRIARGEAPQAPIAGVLGFKLTEAETGRVVFTGEPHRRIYNPIGTVHGGWAATLLDSCMSCAIQTTLAVGEVYTTVEMKVNFVRGITDQTGTVQAIGTLTSRGRRIGTAEGRVVDAKGTILALGTTTCLLMPFQPSA